MTTVPDISPPSGRGVCLICAGEVPLLPGGPLAEHPDSETGQLCTGSGHTRVHDDGRDAVRRHAIRQFAIAMGALAGIRTSLEHDLSTGWRLRYLLDHRFRVAVTQETAADLWRGLAIHGNWLETFRVAVKDAVDRGTRSTDTLDNGLEELVRAGCRTWLRDARWELHAHLDGEVDAKKALSDLLASL